MKKVATDSSQTTTDSQIITGKLTMVAQMAADLWLRGIMQQDRLHNHQLRGSKLRGSKLRGSEQAQGEQAQGEQAPKAPTWTAMPAR